MSHKKLLGWPFFRRAKTARDTRRAALLSFGDTWRAAAGGDDSCARRPFQAAAGPLRARLLIMRRQSSAQISAAASAALESGESSEGEVEDEFRLPRRRTKTDLEARPLRRVGSSSEDDDWDRAAKHRSGSPSTGGRRRVGKLVRLVSILAAGALLCYAMLRHQQLNLLSVAGLLGGALEQDSNAPEGVWQGGATALLNASGTGRRL